MNTEEFARELFKEFVGGAGASDWDWQRLAHRAFEAAEQFEIVRKAKSAPPSSEPSSEPARSPLVWVIR